MDDVSILGQRSDNHYLDELFTVRTAHRFDTRLGKLQRRSSPPTLHRTWSRGHDIGAMRICTDQLTDLLGQLKAVCRDELRLLHQEGSRARPASNTPVIQSARRRRKMLREEVRKIIRCGKPSVGTIPEADKNRNFNSPGIWGAVGTFVFESIPLLKGLRDRGPREKPSLE